MVKNKCLATFTQQCTSYKKNIAIKICRSFYSKQFCIITFFRISYSLTGKWNFHIDYFQVLTYCDSSNFSLIEKCNKNNW